MAAEHCRAATLDRAHDAALTTAERVAVFLTVGRAGLAEDVRQLEPDGTQGPNSEMHGWSRCRRRVKLRQQIEGARRGAHGTGGDLQVTRRRGQATMAQQELNGAQIRARFE